MYPIFLLQCDQIWQNFQFWEILKLSFECEKYFPLVDTLGGNIFQCLRRRITFEQGEPIWTKFSGVVWLDEVNP